MLAAFVVRRESRAGALRVDVSVIVLFNRDVEQRSAIYSRPENRLAGMVMDELYPLFCKVPLPFFKRDIAAYLFDFLLIEKVVHGVAPYRIRV